MSDLNTAYKAFVAKLFNRNGDLSKDFAHAVFGIVTETRELLRATDDINATEEAGDLTFFQEALELVMREHAAAMTNSPTATEAADMRWSIYDHALSHPPAQVIEEFSHDLMEAAKRWVGYGKAPAQVEDLVTKARVVVTLALKHSDCVDISRDTLQRTNMAKLLKRYPGGEFDAFRAVNRDLQGERDALSKAI